MIRPAGLCVPDHWQRAAETLDAFPPLAQAHVVASSARVGKCLRNFETFFFMSVRFACVPPEEPNVRHLFLNSGFSRLPVKEWKGTASITSPLRLTHLADEQKT
jgi:hypothetical protein